MRGLSSNRATLHTGRLLEVRADAGYRSIADVDAIFQEIADATAPLGDAQYVTVVDWRRCPIMSPEAAVHMGRKLGEVNGRTERTGALASQDAPVAVLQFVRLIRDAGHPDRRLFFEQDKVVSWLSEVLTLAETARLRVFLGE